MDAEHGHFRLIGPGSAEITLYADQSRTRVGINKELGQRRLFQSVCIGLHTRHQINRLSSDRDLPEQCQVSVVYRFAGSRKGLRYLLISSIVRFLKIYPGGMRSIKMFLSMIITSPASDRSG